MIGRNTGTVIITWVISSRKKPRTIRTASIKPKIKAGFLKPRRRSYIKSWPPVRKKMLVKQAAPKRIHMIIPLMPMDRTAASLSMDQLSRRLISALTKAPATPTAAASVGEAIPEKMVPKTAPTTAMGRISPLARTISSLKGTLFSLGRAGA